LEVATQELDNRQAALTVTVDEQWLEPFLKTASSRLAGRVAVPGFRKGRAPYQVVLRHLGREALVREVIDEMGKAAYDEAVESSGLEPIQLDEFEVSDFEPLTLNMTVSLPPVVELADYRSKRVALEEVEIEDDDVEEVLRKLQEQYAERAPVERPAALGDFAVIDVEGSVDDRVVLKLDGQEYELRPDAESVVAGFTEEFVGISPEEEKTFSLTFPDDYDDEDLAGREVSFHARVQTLQEKHLPPLDDDLAAMVGGFTSLQELRQKIRDDLQRRREADHKDELADNLLDSLVDEATVDFPPFFLDRELEARVRMLALDLQEQGFTLEGYLQATDRSVDDLLDEFRPAAEKRVKKSLILAELVQREGIEVDDTDIEEEIARITEVYGQDTKAVRDALLKNAQVREDVRNRLYGRRIVERLSQLSEGATAEETADAATQGAASEESVSGEKGSEPTDDSSSD
jgi:trigger factor